MAHETTRIEKMIGEILAEVKGIHAELVAVRQPNVPTVWTVGQSPLQYQPAFSRPTTVTVPLPVSVSAARHSTAGVPGISADDRHEMPRYWPKDF